MGLPEPFVRSQGSVAPPRLSRPGDVFRVQTGHNLDFKPSAEIPVEVRPGFRAQPRPLVAGDREPSRLRPISGHNLDRSIPRALPVGVLPAPKARQHSKTPPPEPFATAKSPHA